jgi:hypothetical protein
MDAALDRRGINLTELAIRADVSQPRISQVRGEGSAPIKLIDRLVDALMPEFVSAEDRNRAFYKLRQEAIAAAFPSGATGDLERVPLDDDGNEISADDRRVIAAFRNQPPAVQSAAKRMLGIIDDDDYKNHPEEE